VTGRGDIAAEGVSEGAGAWASGGAALPVRSPSVMLPPEGGNVPLFPGEGKPGVPSWTKASGWCSARRDNRPCDGQSRPRGAVRAALELRAGGSCQRIGQGMTKHTVSQLSPALGLLAQPMSGLTAGSRLFTSPLSMTFTHSICSASP
jgi:hypothetical protein